MNFLLLSLIKAGVVAGVLMTTLAYLQWVERKVIAHAQIRVGPFRVGPHGLLQPLADIVKLLTKEDMVPGHVNRFFYFLAPFLAVTLALIPICLIPFGEKFEAGPVNTWMQLADVNCGVLLLFGISSVGVYGIALGGWASNNKYSLLGGLRSSAQMISYELPMALAIVGPLLIANSLSFREIVNAQSGFWLGFIPRWSVFQGPVPQMLSFAVFMVAAFAETNRIPFDLPEAENELVGGFHTEYSSMKFASFFMAEYANMINVCCVGTLLFLGGWRPLFPGAIGDYSATVVFLGAGAVAMFHGLNPSRKSDRISLPIAALVFWAIAGLFAIPLVQSVLMPVFWFAVKVGLLLFLFMWIRATLPRYRYDQLMRLAWTFLFPVALLNLLITSLAIALTTN